MPQPVELPSEIEIGPVIDAGHSLASVSDKIGGIFSLKWQPDDSFNILFRADQIDYDEIKFAVHLNGHVTIETSAVAISADEVDYDVNSGDLHASRGDVRMKLKQVAK